MNINLNPAWEISDMYDPLNGEFTHSMVNYNEAKDTVDALTSRIVGLEQQLEAAQKDAGRYRWLRDRMEIRFMASVAGDNRAAFAMRIGHAFCDSTLDPARGWTDPKYFVERQNRVNSAIDVAIRASKAKVA